VKRILSRIVRGLLTFAYPEYPEQQATLRSIARSVEQVDGRLQKLAADHAKATAAIVHAAENDRARLASVADDVRNLRNHVNRQGRVTLRALRRGDARSEATKEERRVLQRLERIAASSRPIVVGPWSGEVGFELLYWIPFIHWFRQRFDVDPRRLIVVSRGGVAGWYSHITPRYAEIFTHLSTDAFRAATEAAKKQRRLNPVDVSLLRRVAAEEDLGRVHVLHPEAMYKIFWAFFKETVPVRRIDDYTSYARLTGGDASEVPSGLPADFVAVRFYFSHCFPDTPENRAFVSEVIETLSAQSEVVMLNTPFAVDDHVDYPAAGRTRVHTIPSMSAERNLAIQTAVIRRARAFVGTYGGYSYLAPFYGVPSVAFHSARTFFSHHLELAQRVFDQLGAPSLVPLHVGDVALLRSALPRAGVSPQSTA
jgi:hypothetical protein